MSFGIVESAFIGNAFFGVESFDLCAGAKPQDLGCWVEVDVVAFAYRKVGVG